MDRRRGWGISYLHNRYGTYARHSTPVLGDQAEKQHPSPSYRVLGRIINRGNDLHGRTTRHLRSTTPLWTKFKLNHVRVRGGRFPPSVLGSWARGRRPGLAKQGYERPVAMETGPRRVGALLKMPAIVR